MKKKILVAVAVISALFIFLICGLFGFTIWAGTAFWDSARNWKQEDQPWNEIQIPISDYDGKVTFETQQAHPFLAEYDYKIKLESNGKTQVFDLPSNTGGSINEDFNLIKYQNKKYLDVRDTLFDLSEMKDVIPTNSDESKYPNHIDDVEFYNIKIKGENSYLGNVTQKDKLVFSTNVNFPNNSNTFYVDKWSEWKDLPTKKGKFRIGIENKNTSKGYTEVLYNSKSAIFEVNTSSNRYDFSIKECEYDDENYIVLNDGVSNIINVNSLIEIKKGTVSWSYGANNSVENVFVKSQFGTNILNQSNIKDAGKLSFNPKELRVE